MKIFALLTLFAPLAAAFAPTPTFSRSTSLRSSMELYSAAIQFIKGLDEKVVPDIKLTRARDGSSGTATFTFMNPNVFDASTTSQGDVTGMFMVDDEGEMSTMEVNANFVQGKPQSIESVVVMKSAAEWDRFMRFMERYGEANGLVFTKA
mmetsp:Transcript_27010/g.39500  ORF Transcript_27010/g.39500 Transcript_27010/m.39500 type:complete len:150 (-) Transcript_27010:115-564(-)|eukprot:CAMPEP_0194047444 /NCGR_PEP_ID=MMETSP0009_2-20130614/24729_1 /TAXON_ID=210454 /ORGANISM="Grammatophora oceanica, Strain CCMP 410" /LENGTH=149 /DNA_ID=CAMNT_0038693073 /DNA_START=109 /DNA_END=558 /DNA_ORIENTATION=+